MPIVVDASVAISWFFAAEQSPEVDSVWEEAIVAGIAVPSIWSYEVANRLGRAVVAGDTTAAEVTSFFHSLDGVATEVTQPSTSVLVARMVSSGLTAYDAAYLEVAVARGIPLATLDVRLRDAAQAAGVTVLPAPES